MARIILITGGTRSGKSDYAEKRAEMMPEPHYYIATCQVTDHEMAERVETHKNKREKKLWQTIEEPIDIITTLKKQKGKATFLIDCVTLWINNILQKRHSEGLACSEEDIALLVAELMTEVKKLDGVFIFVTNEVGMGIVPENRIARLYRDLVGRSNRIIAAAADEVVLVSCGLPLTLKNSWKERYESA